MANYFLLLIVVLSFFPSLIESVWTTAYLTPKNYNPSRPPQVNESEPLEVKLDLKVLSILGISEVEQSFTGTKSLCVYLPFELIRIVL